MVRQRLLTPRSSRSGIFLANPGRSPSALGEEIVTGLLGSSILGFHTQFHCNNFVDTVDHVSSKLGSIVRPLHRFAGWIPDGGTLSHLHGLAPAAGWSESLLECRARSRHINDLPSGTDSVSAWMNWTTPGILERFRAIERLLDLHPVDRPLPVSSRLPRRRGPASTNTSTNRRCGRWPPASTAASSGKGPPPIILRVEHHEPADVPPTIALPNSAFVSSLHDGMNLVAKEFVAARDDERGFSSCPTTGAARRNFPKPDRKSPRRRSVCFRPSSCPRPCRRLNSATACA